MPSYVRDSPAYVQRASLRADWGIDRATTRARADQLARIGMPGTWGSYDSPGGVGYDHRREEWYQAALAPRGQRLEAAALAALRLDT